MRCLASCLNSPPSSDDNILLVLCFQKDGCSVLQFTRLAPQATLLQNVRSMARRHIPTQSSAPLRDCYVYGGEDSALRKNSPALRAPSFCSKPRLSLRSRATGRLTPPLRPSPPYTLKGLRPFRASLALLARPRYRSDICRLAGTPQILQICSAVATLLWQGFVLFQNDLLFAESKSRQKGVSK